MRIARVLGYNIHERGVTIEVFQVPWPYRGCVCCANVGTLWHFHHLDVTFAPPVMTKHLASQTSSFGMSGTRRSWTPATAEAAGAPPPSAAAVPRQRDAAFFPNATKRRLPGRPGRTARGLAGSKADVQKCLPSHPPNVCLHLASILHVVGFDPGTSTLRMPLLEDPGPIA